MFLLAFIVLFTTRTPKTPVSQPKKSLNLSYDESIQILLEIITFHLNERMLVYKINKFITAPPVDAEIIKLTENILKSMSPELVACILQYVTKEHLTRFIGSACRETVMGFIEKKQE